MRLNVAWVNSRRNTMRSRALLVMMPLFGLLPGATPISSLTVEVEHLRSEKGLLQVCMTRDPAFFPDCENDPKAIKRTTKANDGNIELPALPVGRYALAMIHDENSNSKLDTFAGIPKEGVGFSRNPKLSFGAPKFDNVVFDATAGAITQRVKLKYFL